MPDYMDLEAWGCPDDQDLDGKSCVEDLVAALANEAERPKALQALLADRFAAEDVVRSPAWPSFCASIGALLSDPQPDTAVAGVTFLERVLDETLLSDALSVAELFTALAGHLRSYPVSKKRLCMADRAPKPAHLPALNAPPAVPQVKSGRGAESRVAHQSGPETQTPCNARSGSNSSAASIAVDCRAGSGHLQRDATEELGSTALISAASHNFIAHFPQHSLHAACRPAQELVTAPPQGLCTGMLQNSIRGGDLAAQQSMLGSPREARARQFRLLGKMLEALPKLWVCLKPPMMRKLWQSLSALLLVEPQWDSMPAAASEGTARTPQDSRQPMIKPASRRKGTAEVAQALEAPALEACLVGMQGPLVELSLAQQPAMPHAKSWWQAWTLPISSTRWLPSALEERGVLPGIVTCCYVVAYSPDRCKSTHAAEVLAVQILGTALGLVQCWKLFPVCILLGPSELQVTCRMALSCLISIASDQYRQSGNPHTSGASTSLGRSACEALHACLRSERAAAELLTPRTLLALSRAHQLEQLCCGRSAPDAGCASLRRTASEGTAHPPLIKSIVNRAKRHADAALVLPA